MVSCVGSTRCRSQRQERTGQTEGSACAETLVLETAWGTCENNIGNFCIAGVKPGDPLGPVLCTYTVAGKQCLTLVFFLAQKRQGDRWRGNPMARGNRRALRLGQRQRDRMGRGWELTLQPLLPPPPFPTWPGASPSGRERENPCIESLVGRKLGLGHLGQSQCLQT